MSIAPMTQLEAINICLSSLGEPPINTLDGAGIDAQLANDQINEINRSLQLKGWHWNIENHRLTPDVDGFINVPANTLRIDTTTYDARIDVVQRGSRLYNRTDNTYVFPNPLYLEIVVALPFEELPAAARDYIASLSSMILQQRILGSSTINTFLQQKAQLAMQELMREENKIGDPNILRDNWSTRGVVSRGWFRRGAYL